MAIEWPAVLFVIGPGTVAAIATVATIYIRRRNRDGADGSSRE